MLDLNSQRSDGDHRLCQGQSNYEAARLARAYRFDEATALIDEGDAVMKNAHDAHLANRKRRRRIYHRCPCSSCMMDQFMSSGRRLFALEIMEVYRKLQRSEQPAA
ncbi:MAG: hypothetical protein ACLVJ6_11315 [Merdibacter sp.]